MTTTRIGAEIKSDAFWNERSANYADEMKLAYHQHRLGVVRAMLPDLRGAAVLDFGCGDGVMMRACRDLGASSALGIDPNASLLAIAEKNGAVVRGSSEAMSDIPTKSLDLILSLNVLAYLTQEQEAQFYREARRILKPGAALLVTHSNALFDLFTLNAYTRDAFKREFSCDPAPLLAKPETPAVVTYNVRENPLAYAIKLAALGFTEDRQEFINFHETPPLLSPQTDYMNLARPRRDTLDWPPAERWKLMFQCSTFASLSTKR